MRLRAHRRAILIAVGAFIALGVALLWPQLDGGARMLRTIGIAEPRGGEMPVCTNWDYGWVSRFVRCDSPLVADLAPTESPYRLIPAFGPAGGFRRVQIAQYNWPAADSLSWIDTRDSIRIAMEDRGGHYVSCGNPNTWSPPGYPDEGIFRWQGVWRFRGYYVESTAYRLVQFAQSPTGAAVRAGNRPTLWLLSMTGTRDEPRECAADGSAGGIS